MTRGRNASERRDLLRRICRSALYAGFEDNYTFDVVRIGQRGLSRIGADLRMATLICGSSRPTGHAAARVARTLPIKRVEALGFLLAGGVAGMMIALAGGANDLDLMSTPLAQSLSKPLVLPPYAYGARLQPSIRKERLSWLKAGSVRESRTSAFPPLRSRFAWLGKVSPSQTMCYRYRSRVFALAPSYDHSVIVELRW